jgi:hypothetical protein
MNLFAGEEKAETATQFALTTSTLQGTYFMLAARALGLDVGAMGGFDTCALDARSSGTARRSGSRTSATATTATFSRALRGLRLSTKSHASSRRERLDEHLLKTHTTLGT